MSNDCIIDLQNTIRLFQFVRHTLALRNHHVCTCFSMMRACLAMMYFVIASASICVGYNLEYHDLCGGCPKKSQFSLH